MELQNPNPEVKLQSYKLSPRSLKKRVQQELNFEQHDEIDSLEIFDLVKSINDPEHPLTLEQLNIVSPQDIKIQQNYITLYFTPTIPHCSLSQTIGLFLKVKLIRSLPERMKIIVLIKPGTHSQEIDVNKQINDKERIAAALENPRVIQVVNKGIRFTDIKPEILEKFDIFEQNQDSQSSCCGKKTKCYGRTFTHFLDESIYKVNFINGIYKQQIDPQTGKKNRIFTAKEYKAIPCQKEFFQVKGSEDYFRQLNNLDQLYCLDPQEIKDDPPVILGDWTSDYYATFYITITACKNSSKCKPENEIKRQLDQVYWAIYYTDTMVTPQSYNQPFTYYPRDYADYGSYSCYKHYQMNIQNVYIDTDDEIEKLKQILLSKQQREVFEYLSSPIIYEEDLNKFEQEQKLKKQQNMQKLTIDDEIQLEKEKLQHLFKQITQLQQSSSTINKRLINLLLEQKLGINPVVENQDIFEQFQQENMNQNYIEQIKCSELNQSNFNSKKKLAPEKLQYTELNDTTINNLNSLEKDNLIKVLSEQQLQQQQQVTVKDENQSVNQYQRQKNVKKTCSSLNYENINNQVDSIKIDIQKEELKKDKNYYDIKSNPYIKTDKKQKFTGIFENVSQPILEIKVQDKDDKQYLDISNQTCQNDQNSCGNQNLQYTTFKAQQPHSSSIQNQQKLKNNFLDQKQSDQNIFIGLQNQSSLSIKNDYLNQNQNLSQISQQINSQVQLMFNDFSPINENEFQQEQQNTNIINKVKRNRIRNNIFPGFSNSIISDNNISNESYES
ncbi:hypothetical protein PPERSA_02385 [Pseudocohnilembus persalinus]|uniref:MIP18 family-like domain-containing protein n=1 Tax=Pseudocohnilembus persalinus TaxID=266149 RepID=A0A0V0Q8S7_PSEPJ|nr:hypothetical protein PPERSA_02385 [Pseudocohnilembus persalinus]|eukprot:KRW98577.1 hypothetical protein PPERSA_02385 [Pseudocohnilembus persalinus]